MRQLEFSRHFDMTVNEMDSIFEFEYSMPIAYLTVQTRQPNRMTCS